MFPLILAHAPAGASIRQVTHYGQVFRFKAFRRYNYNAIKNLAIYGQLFPPKYDLSKVTAPTYLHYGLSDMLVYYKDLLLLASTLPNVVGIYQVQRYTFNHLDFVWALDAKKEVYDNVILLMKDAEYRL